MSSTHAMYPGLGLPRGASDAPSKSTGRKGLLAEARKTKLWFEDRVLPPIRTGADRVHREFMPGLTVTGGAIAAGSSYALARKVTPYLLSVSQEVAEVTRAAESIPFVGPMLGGLFVRGSVFGMVASAVSLLSLVYATMTAEPGAERKLAWAATHATLGLALSPLWGLTAVTGATMGCLAVALGCLFVTSMVLNRSLVTGGVAQMPMLTATTALFAAAPIPAQLVTGVAREAIVGKALLTLALGSVLGLQTRDHVFCAHAKQRDPVFDQRAGRQHGGF